MRALFVVIGFAIGFALIWWAMGMVDSTRATVHTAPQSAAVDGRQPLPRLLQPGLGFAFLQPRH